MNVPLNKWKHENLCSERLLLCNSCCYKPHLVTCGNKSILIWDLFLCQYQYAQSLKSEWCPRFSRCSSFWTLAWCSCSCVRGTRCLPCHFGTTWNWRAWARWCTVPKRGKRLTCFWLVHIQWPMHNTHLSEREKNFNKSLLKMKICNIILHITVFTKHKDSTNCCEINQYLGQWKWLQLKFSLC